MNKKDWAINLKCPFCKTKLDLYEQSKVNARCAYYCCPNYDCDLSSGLCGTEEMWAYLIACLHKDSISKNVAKKHLEILNDVSAYIEDNANFDEDSQKLLKKLDSTIDWVYDKTKDEEC